MTLSAQWARDASQRFTESPDRVWSAPPAETPAFTSLEEKRRKKGGNVGDTDQEINAA